MHVKQVALCGLAFMLTAAVVVADVPREMTFQGQLTGNGTAPVSVEVRFYDAATDGNLLWSETHPDVPRPGGVFVINIGSQTSGGIPAETIDATEVWLGISINNGGELAPRTRLTSTPYSLNTRGLVVDDSGNVGIGTGPQSRLDVDGRIFSSEISFYRPDPTNFRVTTEHNALRIDGWDTRFYNNGQHTLTLGLDRNAYFSGPVRFNPEPNNYWVGVNVSGSNAGRLELNGHNLCLYSNHQERLTFQADGATWFHQPVDVPVLRITGGSDLAEPGHVSAAGLGADAIQPGMIVSIDPANPGKLIIATEAYDRRVAGVISGAGGVKPGIYLEQEGHAVSEGEHPIAMAGKVYVWCDADANGPIQPGDRLTTSNTAGHAMRVADNDRSIGAVVGKAMDELTHGKGLVLMLVQSQ